jgi:hypothetical protein
MLRKNNEVKWNTDAINSFEMIKKALVDVPVLIILDYSKEFLIFSFAFDDTLVVVLLQKNKGDLEKPIAFFRRALRDVEIKYDIMEKQAYTLVKSLKAFRVYILHSNTIAYVPSNGVRKILFILMMMEGEASGLQRS